MNLEKILNPFSGLWQTELNVKVLVNRLLKVKSNLDTFIIERSIKFPSILNFPKVITYLCNYLMYE